MAEFARRLTTEEKLLELQRDQINEIKTDNNFSDALKSKLEGIELGATADQTASEIKTLYENNSDTNAYTDSEKTKLGGIESEATADQTATEIKTLYENNNDTNAFTDSEKTKLGTVESNANDYSFSFVKPDDTEIDLGQ